MTRSIAVTSERLGRIVEEAASEVYVFGVEDFYFRLVNKGARENLGYNADELSRLTPWDLKPRIRRDDFLALIRPLLAGEVDRLDFDTVHRRKDGSEYDVSVKLQLFDDGDDPVFYAAIQDTTEYRRVEQRLRDTAQRLDVILDNTTMAVFLMDDRQHCVFMNRAAEKLTGYAFEETTGRPLHDVIHHTRPDGSHFPLSECAIDRAFPERAGVQGEEVFVHKDGGFYPVAFTASPIHGEGAQVIGTVIEARDISEEKRNAEVRALLMHEVDHRARNLLAIVQSLVRLTRADELENYKSILAGRIGAWPAPRPPWLAGAGRAGGWRTSSGKNWTPCVRKRLWRSRVRRSICPPNRCSPSACCCMSSPPTPANMEPAAAAAVASAWTGRSRTVRRP